MSFVNDIGKVATALGLFASAIKSGESWTPACEQAQKDAHEALTRIGGIADGLEGSVRLQSHYAAMLNAYDDGQRLTFQDGAAWLERLASLKAPTPD